MSRYDDDRRRRSEERRATSQSNPDPNRFRQDLTETNGCSCDGDCDCAD